MKNNYSIIILIILLNRIVLENLVVIKPSKNYPFVWNPIIHIHVYRKTPFSPVMK